MRPISGVGFSVGCHHSHSEENVAIQPLFTRGDDQGGLRHIHRVVELGVRKRVNRHTRRTESPKLPGDGRLLIVLRCHHVSDLNRDSIKDHLQHLGRRKQAGREVEVDASRGRGRTGIVGKVRVRNQYAAAVPGSGECLE